MRPGWSPADRSPFDLAGDLGIEPSCCGFKGRASSKPVPYILSSFAAGGEPVTTIQMKFSKPVIIATAYGFISHLDNSAGLVGESDSNLRGLDDNRSVSGRNLSGFGVPMKYHHPFW